jgi:hypothetical protein
MLVTRGLKYKKQAWQFVSRSESRGRIHERNISLRYLGKILRVLRLEVSVYNVNALKTSLQPLLLKWAGGGGEWNPLLEMTVNSKEENS